jgi:hypothetical protein
MIRLFASILVALVIMGALAVAVQADTTPVSGTLTGTSILTATSNPAVFDSSFTGSGIDTASGPYTTKNTSIVTFTSLTTFTDSGTFTDVFAGGTLFGTFSGMGTVTATGSDITLLDMITGGTGTRTGDTGEITVTGTSTTAGAFTGTYTGFITTPEPSSLALMLAGIGLLPLMRKRLARGQQAT